VVYVVFSYLVAWIIYIAAVVGLLKLYNRSLALYLPEEIRPVILVLFASVMLTPWPIDSDTWTPAPAIISALFHLLSGFGVVALKSLFPVLVVSTVACLAAWWISRRKPV
jgi:hypothetical protein